jgi:autotransporter-associated beta strand protein
MKSRPNRFLRPAALAASIVLCLGQAAFAAIITWDSNTGATGAQDGGGNWTTNAGGWWNGTTNVNWASGDQAIFGAGTDSTPPATYAITIGGSITTANGNATTGGLNFSNSNYILSAASPQTISVGNTNNTTSVIKVSSGKTATIGNNVTVQRAGGTGGQLALLGGGTLEVASGGILRSTFNNVSEVANGSTLWINGGTVNMYTTLIVGQNTTAFGLGGTVKVDSGALNVTTNNIIVGRTAGDVSNFTMNGGTVTITAGHLRTDIGTATIILNSGTLTTTQIYRAGGTMDLVLNGGTIKAAAASVTDFIASSISSVTVNGGGVNIDSNGRAITASAALLGGTGNGSLTLNDTAVSKGTLTLTGANTYTGSTIIQAGTLKLGTGGSIANSALVDVRSGANFDVITAGFTLGAGKTLKGSGTVAGTVTVGNTGIVTGGDGTIGKLTIGSLTFSNTGIINVGTLANYSAGPAVDVTGTLTLSGASGAVTINLPTAATTSGTYKLLGFGSGISDATGFTLGTGPTLGPRQSGSGLQYDGTNKLIIYTISAVNPIWTGAQTSEWSTNVIAGSKNWKLPDSSPTDFLTGDEVLFDDYATSKTVDVSNGNVTPASATFTNTTGNDYTLQGSNGIAGTAVLTKSGTGNLTISNANTYTGATAVNNGSLVLNGSLGSTAITVAGAATFTQGSAGSIGGTASLTTSGTTTLAGANTYSGATNVNGGSLTISGTGTLGSGSAITLGGGSLNLGGTSQTVGVVSITAPSTSGDTISNGSLTGTSYAASNTSGNAIIAANLLANGSAGFIKSGAGTTTLSGINSYTGATAVSAGTLKAGSSSAFTNIGVLSMSDTGIFDLGGNNAAFTNLTNTATNTITTTGASPGTDTLTISGLNATIGGQFTDDGVRKLAISLNGTGISPLTNANSTFSGGLSVVNMRLAAASNSATTGGRFGKGSITIGSNSQMYMTSGVTISNDFIINANDNVGSRTGSFRLQIGTGVTSVLSGTINANAAVAGFGSDGASAGATLELTGKLTGTNGFSFFKSDGAFAWTTILNNSLSNNDYAGTTTIGANTTVKLGTANQIPNGTTTNLVSLTGILDLNGLNETVNGLTGVGVVDNVTTGTTNTLTLGDNNATGNTFSGLIKNTAGSLSLIKIGTGTQTLSGANTFTGGLTIKNGTIIAGTVNTALGASSAGVANGLSSVTLGDTSGTNSASLLVSTTALNFANPIVLATNATSGPLSLGNTGTAISTTFSGGVTGSNDLTIISNATTGTVSLTTAAINNVGNVTNTGAGSGTTTISSSIGANVTEVIENSATSTLSLSGNNSSFLGNYSMNNGRMAVGGSFAANAASTFNLGATSAGSNNTTLSVVNAIALANDINVRAGNSGTKTITLGTSADIVATLSGKVTLDDNLILDATGSTAAASLTLSGNIVDGTSGAKGLTKNSAGVVILSGTASDFSGSVAINVGELRISNAAALGNTTSITVNAGRLSLDGGITTGSGKSVTINGNGTNFFGALQSNSGHNVWEGDVVIGATGGTRIGVNGGSLKVTGTISGSSEINGLTLRPNSGTTLELSGENSYLGDTTIVSNTGEVKLSGGADRLPTGTKLIFGGSGVSGILNLNGQNQEIAGLSVNSGTSNEIKSATAATLTVNTAASSPSTYAGKITGATALTKTGADTLTLSGTNTYTGDTTITTGTLALTGTGSIADSANLVVDGTLDVSGITAGTFTVGATQKLSGDGTITATGKTFEIAGTHSVGNSPGQQDITGNVTYTSTSIFEWDLAANTDTDGADNDLGATADNGARGTHFDAVDITGNLTIDADATFKVIMNTGVNFADTFWTSNQTFSNIWNATGTLTSGWEDQAVSVYNTSNVLQNVSSYGAFTITGSTLTWTAVPEPTSALVGLLIGAGLLRRKRL